MQNSGKAASDSPLRKLSVQYSLPIQSLLLDTKRLLDVTKSLGNMALVKILQSPTALPASVRNRDVVLRLVTQSCLTPCDPLDCSPPDSFVHGDSPGRSSQPRDRTQVSRIESRLPPEPPLSIYVYICFHKGFP